jgi:hypothetical protein
MAVIRGSSLRAMLSIAMVPFRRPACSFTLDSMRAPLGGSAILASLQSSCRASILGRITLAVSPCGCHLLGIGPEGDSKKKATSGTPASLGDGRRRYYDGTKRGSLGA